jgi:hypothetical protein
VLFWGESAGNGVMLGAAPVPGTVNALNGVQAFIMPRLGVEFGP